MKYLQELLDSRNDPKRIEDLYQAVCREGAGDEFKLDVMACYEQAPSNILYAAWYYRLQAAQIAPQKISKSANWKLAVPLSLVNGLIFWALSDTNLEFRDHIPYLVLLWAPIAALVALGFLAFTAQKHYRRFLVVGVSLAAASGYVLLSALGQGVIFYRDYLNLMAIQFALLAWIGLGISVLGKSSASERFAFLIKSIEVMVTAGVYLIVGMMFGGITYGLFAALGIYIPDVFLRLIAAGGVGLIPVLAVASVYDPAASPAAQDFGQGLSKLVFTMMRLLLPLTLGVLVVYLLALPFSFMEPFENREVLFIYNVMLFAIMGLLIGTTPMSAGDVAGFQRVLRRGILAVAILTVLISLHALAAIVYRTMLGGLTINRLTIIGWNSVNIGILVLLIYRQFRRGQRDWVETMQAVFSLGVVAYTVWAIFLTVAIPLFFR